MNGVRDLIIKEELIGEIKRLAEENQLYAENEARFVKKILALNNKVANLHKVISKLQTKVARQKENITTLLHLYTSGKRSKSHKKLREKYRALKARIAELEAGLISAGKQQGLYLQELMDLRAAQRWIPVSEKPKVDGRYLLRNIYDDIYPAKFVAESESWMLGRYDTVTHWMPLPPNPESPNDTQTQTIVYGKERE